ncbi:CBO0543 family protein [Ornithinibacillus scapharcae]|uniref:CBO0543 family protein n=1 Tax=Ornithinibacillus scapharcae TaxID=1147159 RepID=UPI000225B0B5
MTTEFWILLSAYIISTGILFFIPKSKLRLAVVAFLLKQVLTFLLGLVVVEFGLIEYPVRLFPTINRTSFTFEFYVFPVICAAFNVWYPNGRSVLFRFGYYAGFCTVMSIIEIILEKHTDLIKYIHWDWYLTWITLFLSFFIVHLLCIWFFKGKTA